MSHIGSPPCDAGQILRGAHASPCPAVSRRWTLVAAILGSSMAFVDGTVVNVALPALQRELGASASQAQWIIESYSLFLAALLLVGGALGDRLGRRRVFMAGAGLFSAASLACALSGSAGQLIAARAVQGVGAALLVPGSLSLISATFPQSQRGQAIGTWSAFSGITAAVGPVLGGFLIDHFSWHWAFLINVPLGAVLLAICAARVPESRGAAAEGRLDLWGAALATIGLAGIVYAFIEAPAQGWSAPVVMGAALVGVAGLALFVAAEARSPAPMLPLRLLRIRDFAGTNLLTLLLYAALGGGLFYFPLDLIQVQGYGATAAGAAMLPFIAIMFLLSRWAGKLVDTWGPRLPLVAGPLVAALGFALFALPSVGASYGLGFLPAVCTLGLGMAITVAPLTTTVMNSVGPELAGVASGVNNAVSRAAGLLAIAVFGMLMSAAFDAALAQKLSQLQLPAGLHDAIEGQRHRLAAIVVPDGVDQASASAIRQAVGEAFVAGFRRVMLACAALAALSALSAWLLIEGRRDPADVRPAPASPR
ncbi:MAG TPA: MFS transporter [Albitalea sp.]|uniref:MFS transporter n=1 Tax=Piscinibacter sp. TaxID=1903157 RepID=UPI002ED49B52